MSADSHTQASETNPATASGHPDQQETTVMQIRNSIADAHTRFRAASRSVQLAVVVGAGALLFAAASLIGGSDKGGGIGTTFETRRGTFDVIVREGGNIEALKSQQIRSAIRGNQGVKILSIVEEGYRVTPEDVADGMILVELDSSGLEEQKLNQEIAYETAEAQYVERKAQLEIRMNQNVASLNSATQTMKFARLDFERFLGANVAAELMAKLQIEERLARSDGRAAEPAAQELDNRLRQIADARQARQQGRRGDAGRADVARVETDRSGASGAETLGFDPSSLEQMPPQFRERMEQIMAENGGQIPAEMLQRMQGGPGGPAGAPRERQNAMAELELADDDVMVATPAMLMDEDYLKVRATLDFTAYADETRLEDGEAKQRLRALQEDVRVADENYLQVVARLEGQRRLADRDFITPNDLEVEESKLLQAENRLRVARTERELYTQYTFPKEAEQQLANYENAIMSYQRTRAEGDSELAQAQARFKAAERRLNLEAEKLADINEQLDQTVIRAQRPGLVVYGSAEQSGQPFRGGNQEPIGEGATIRERQPILTIPDMTEMAVRVNIHESAVQRVAEGQTVRVRIDAFPNVILTGEVTKVAVVADSSNAFMNPDMKVYPTMVKVDGIHEWLRPGMSAEVEILVESLEDAVYIPLQAVSYLDDQQIVHVVEGGRSQPRVVEVGTFSEQFIEITSGLRQGERVMLLPPSGSS